MARFPKTNSFSLIMISQPRLAVNFCLQSPKCQDFIMCYPTQFSTTLILKEICPFTKQSQKWMLPLGTLHQLGVSFIVSGNSVYLIIKRLAVLYPKLVPDSFCFSFHSSQDFTLHRHTCLGAVIQSIFFRKLQFFSRGAQFSSSFPLGWGI